MFWFSGLYLATDKIWLLEEDWLYNPAHLKVFPKGAFDVRLLSPFSDVFVVEWCEISKDSKRKHRKYLLSPGEMKVDPRYRCVHLEAYWLSVEAGVRARCHMSSLNIFRRMFYQVAPEKARK